MPGIGILWRQQAAAIRARAPRLSLSPPNPAIRRRIHSKPPKPSSSDPSAPQSRRISRILAGASRFMPLRLQSALQDLRSAPLSHIFAFLVLHEITAILPIFGLTYAFYTLDVDVSPRWIVAEDGLEKWTNYFRKKGWFGLDREGDATREKSVPAILRGEPIDGMTRKDREAFAPIGANSIVIPSNEETAVDLKSRAVSTMWKANSQPKEVKSMPPNSEERASEAQNIEKNNMAGEKFQKILCQVAVAYGVTKLLLVPRIALSLWLTPWLARGFVGFRLALRRIQS